MSARSQQQHSKPARQQEATTSSPSRRLPIIVRSYQFCLLTSQGTKVQAVSPTIHRPTQLPALTLSPVSSPARRLVAGRRPASAGRRARRTTLTGSSRAGVRRTLAGRHLGSSAQCRCRGMGLQADTTTRPVDLSTCRTAALATLPVGRLRSTLFFLLPRPLMLQTPSSFVTCKRPRPRRAFVLR